MTCAHAVPLLVSVVLIVGCPPRGEPERRQGSDQRSSAASKRKSRALRALPYLNWVPIQKRDRGLKGVTRQHPTKTFKGINLYNSRPRSKALLLDMYGKVLHSWSSKLGQPSAQEMAWTKIWPHLADFAGWHHVELLPSGDLLVINCYHSVVKVDWESRVKWSSRVSAHHDLHVTSSGEILTIAAMKRGVKRGKRTLQILDNQIVTLAPNGKIERRLSLFDVLRRDRKIAAVLEKKLEWAEEHFANNFAFYHMSARALLPKKKVHRLAVAVRQILEGTFPGTERLELMMMTMLQPMDILHANSVEPLERDVAGLGDKGDLLISVRDLDLVAVLDPATKRVKWSWGTGELDRQHHPSLLSNDHLLIFDNGQRAKRSRVIELDPRSKKIVWSYQGKPPRSFFSAVRGSCQELPNGSILITDSERGRVIEVTREHEVVWEFFNPDLDDPFAGRARAPIYRMLRFSADYLGDRSLSPAAD
jgi:hypothetical protein